MGLKLDAYGDGFLRVLVRRQLRLSCTAGGVLFAGLAAIALANRLLPGDMALRAGGLAISWWALAVLALPLQVVIAWAYVLRSDDTEDEIVGMIDASTLPVLGTLPPGSPVGS